MANSPLQIKAREDCGTEMAYRGSEKLTGYAIIDSARKGVANACRSYLWSTDAVFRNSQEPPVVDLAGRV